jgi:hypothetical protein
MNLSSNRQHNTYTSDFPWPCPLWWLGVIVTTFKCGESVARPLKMTRVRRPSVENKPTRWEYSSAQVIMVTIWKRLDLAWGGIWLVPGEEKKWQVLFEVGLMRGASISHVRTA